MKFVSTEADTTTGTATPGTIETMELKDHAGNVLKRFTKSADGSFTEENLTITAAVARVVQGTIDTALSNDDSVITLGGLIGTEGVDFAGDDDGTELIPWIAANIEKIPADSVHDDTGGQFSVTFHPGANSIPFVSGDAKLTFAETTAGVDEIRTIAVDATPFVLPDPVPVVPLTTPAVQDVIDALITLGLVTQSD